MYILLALVGACALGIGLHFLLPGRELRGVVVTPAIATAASGAIYTLMQWAGVAETDVWLWVASAGGGLLLALAATALITGIRRAADARTAQRLGI